MKDLKFTEMLEIPTKARFFKIFAENWWKICRTATEVKYVIEESLL